MSIYRLLVTVAGKVPLRTVLIIPFVLQIFGTVGLVGYLSWKNGQKAVNEVASQLRSEISDHTSDLIGNYLRTPHQINLTNANTIRLGQLDINNSQALERHFLQQIQVFDSLSRIYFSNSQGGFVSVGDDERGLTIASTENFVKGNLRVYSVDNQGSRQKILVNSQNYDARNRPFYQSAVDAGKPIWSPIYVYFPSSLGLGLAASYPFYDQTGQFQGVLSSDLSLVAINDFLSNIKIGNHGEAFIIERSGMIVASSSSEVAFIDSADGNDKKRLKATESNNQLIQFTAQHLTSSFTNLNKINTPIQIEFTIESKRQFAQVTPFQDKFGLNWLIVVVVPESDFMEQINANTQTTVLLCIGALIVSIGIGVFTTLWITEPILQLNTAAKKIAQGEWDTKIENKRFDEVGQLAESFNQMTSQLQTSFAALRESESRLTQFLEALPVGVTVHNPRGKATYANSTAKQIMAMDTLPDTRTEQLVEDYQVYLSGTEQPYPLEQLPVVKALSGQSSTVDDIDLHRPDCIVPLQVWATPIYDETSQVVYAIVTFVDITERKQSEKILEDYNRSLENQVAQRTTALQKSEATLKAAQRVAHVGSWEFDLITQKITWSEEQFRIFGLDPTQGEPSYEQHMQQIHPDDRASVQKTHSQLIATGKTDELDFRILRPNGEVRYVSGRGETVVNEQGEVIKFFGTTMDITPRKLAEVAVQKSEERFREIAGTVSQFFFVRCANSGNYLYVSPAYKTIWGRTCESLYQNPQSWIETVHPDDRQLLEASLIQQFQGNPVKREYRIIRPDGQERWIAADILLVRDKTGQPQRFVGLAEDITERKQTQVQLQQAKEAADAANQTKSQFLANMSHELRTPLNAILGFSQWISKSPQLTREHKDNLKIIIRSGEHLLTLINQVLDLSKIEAGRITLNEMAFDLFHLLDDLEKVFQLKASNKGLQLVFNRSDDIPQYVKADQVKLRQVLTNLLSNAIKFTKEGSVFLKVRGHRAGDQRSDLKEGTNSLDSFFLHFEIQDTGVGIAREELESIFEAFVQAKTGRESREGTGLGLSISSKFVQLMGGQITVNSVVDKGSTFKFKIRVSVVEPEAIETQQSTRRIIALEPNQPPVASEINPTQANTLNPDALAVLPTSWLASLHQATFEGDFEQMLVLIEQIRPQEAQLAEALSFLAKNLQYRKILELLEKNLS